MDILLYLTELLQTRKTIGIVGLGTLYKKKLPGKYDAEQHAFVPPSYVITFTTEIKEQEELANYISYKRNISTDSANYYISEFAVQVQTQLAEQKEADLEPIGTLKLVNDEITLVVQQKSDFEFYGLPTLTEISIEEKSTPETTELEENKLAEKNPDQETTENLEESKVVNYEQETFEEIVEENKLAEENAEEGITVNDEQETFEEIVEENKIEETTTSEEATEDIEENVPETTELDEIAQENKLEEENPGQETTENIEESIVVNDEQETFDEIAEVENRPTEVVENTFITPPVIENLEEEDDDDFELFAKNKVEKQVDIAEDEPKKGVSTLIKVLIVLLVIIVAGAIAYFINPTLFNINPQDKQEEKTKTVPVAKVDSLKIKADSLQADSLAKANAMVSLTVDTPVVENSKVITYEVLVISVATDKKANRIIAGLAKRGIAAKKIYLSKTMINISAGTFEAEYPAKLYRDSLRKVLKDDGIYIQPIYPKTHKK